MLFNSFIISIFNKIGLFGYQGWYKIIVVIESFSIPKISSSSKKICLIFLFSDFKDCSLFKWYIFDNVNATDDHDYCEYYKIVG